MGPPRSTASRAWGQKGPPRSTVSRAWGIGPIVPVLAPTSRLSAAHCKRASQSPSTAPLPPPLSSPASFHLHSCAVIPNPVARFSRTGVRDLLLPSYTHSRLRQFPNAEKARARSADPFGPAATRARAPSMEESRHHPRSRPFSSRRVSNQKTDNRRVSRRAFREPDSLKYMLRLSPPIRFVAEYGHRISSATVRRLLLPPA